MNKKEDLIKKVDDLCNSAIVILNDFPSEPEDLLKLMYTYQQWYTEANFVIKQIIPDRLQEFKDQYESKTHSLKIEDITFINYTISDFLASVRITKNGKNRFNHKDVALMKFIRQTSILSSAREVLNSSLTDMQGMLQSELHDNELSKARELCKYKYIMPAGVIAGVVLEGHLSNVCLNNEIGITKNNPSLSDYNDSLKKENIVDVTNWRWIQRLGDIRNLCAHKKERMPTEDEVLELIDGVDKAIKTIY